MEPRKWLPKRRDNDPQKEPFAWIIDKLINPIFPFLFLCSSLK